MAALSTRMKIFQYIASVSAPVLHEILLLRGRRSQEEGQVRLNAPRRGIRVLDIRPETPGEAMGLQVGDIILRVNGRDVNSETMLNSILEKYPPYITVDIIDEKNNEKSLEYRDFQKGIGDLGVIFVPRQTGHFYYIEDPPGLLWWLIKKFLKMRKTEADNH